MSFRDNLLYLRDSRNMTQEHLAMLLGVTRQAVSKWEAGASTPDMDKLVRLCEIFEVDLDEMIRGDVTARTVNQALAIPDDAPVSDVTGYDPHMRSRAFLHRGAPRLPGVRCGERRAAHARWRRPAPVWRGLGAGSSTRILSIS